MGESILPELSLALQPRSPHCGPRASDTALESNPRGLGRGPCPQGTLPERGDPVWEAASALGCPLHPLGPPAPRPSPVSMQIHIRWKLEAGIYFYADETLQGVCCIRDLMKAGRARRPLYLVLSPVGSWFLTVENASILRSPDAPPRCLASPLPPNRFYSLAFSCSVTSLGKKSPISTI